MSQKVLAVVLLSVLAIASEAQTDRKRWVDSVFQTLNRQEKAAQLFMIPAGPSEKAAKDALDLVEDGIGGIYITHGGPVSHAVLVNRLQRAASTKLLVAAAAEWGIGQTLDSVASLPKPMVIGALPNDSLVDDWASAMARQLSALGIHLHLGPNADDEIFAGDYLRYFGDSEKLIGTRASALIQRLREEGILTVARHLPRRWSTTRQLPDSMIVLSLSRIDTATLQPFQQLIRTGVAGIATDYLHFSIQNEQGIVPAAVSQAFVPEVLRKQLRFDGLVVVDAKTLSGRMGKMRQGDAELLAFQTGADVILQPLHASAGIKKIVREVRKNKILEQQLDESVRKLLAAKYDAGLHHYTPVNTDNLVRRLNHPELTSVTEQVAAAAVTVVQNIDSLLPVRTLDNTSFVSISIGRESGHAFDQALEKYVPFRKFNVMSAGDTSTVTVLPGDRVVIGVFPYQAGLERKIQRWINKLATLNNVILVHFSNPKSLENFSACQALVAAYTDQDGMPEAAAHLIFGGTKGRGVLPLAVGIWPAGTHQPTPNLNRLSYGTPESVGVSSATLSKIRPIMEEAIASGATPGAHTLVIKDGKVIYSESAGYLTWEKNVPVTEETIFDLASVTKISATLQTVLFMHDHGLIDINKKASVYLPELKNSNKADFTLKDILTHQAGLWPFLPFWAQTMSGNQWLPEYYSTSATESYPYPVADNLFASRSMKDSLWQWIIKARIREKPSRTPYDYRYSDMGFYILQHLAEKLLNQPMEDFLAQNLYEPLGAYTTGYLPLQRFPRERIAPTERDTLFRKSQLVGYVHDQGAAMHGGIAGHAGLFSAANDLAKIGQMWLQEGRYGGLQYYKPETIELFTTKQYADSRRGLGWDKPIPSDWNSPTSLYASGRTFGHTGFTGTCIWVDPEFNLVYIFLSNRVMPDMNNNKLLSANIRPRIQHVIYQAIFDYCATGK